ncbi:hydrolase, NUDIX family protein [Cryptosporidium serpentis]
MNDLLAAGIILFTLDEHYIPKFLLLRCSKGKHWSPPKGHCDKHEIDNLLTTALRETYEETGIEKDNIKIYDFEKKIHYKAWGKNKTVVYFLGECTNTTVVLSHEHDQYIWAYIEEARSLIEHESLFETFIQALEKLNIKLN